MPKVGKAIRQSHFWVPADKWIHCVLDSVGGHGTDMAIAIYTEELAKMKVKLVHQIPQSLDTNVLDLGTGDSGSGEERRMSNPEVTGSKPSQSLISVGTQDLDLCRSNLAQCDVPNGAICTVPRSVPRNIVPLAHGAC